MSFVSFDFSFLQKIPTILSSFLPNEAWFQQNGLFFYNINTIQVIFFTQIKLSVLGNSLFIYKKSWQELVFMFCVQGFSIDTIFDWGEEQGRAYYKLSMHSIPHLCGIFFVYVKFFVHKILRDLQSFHFVFKITISKMRNLMLQVAPLLKLAH